MMPREEVTHTWDNEGFEETYEYDVYGNKSSVTNAFGEETRYSTISISGW